MTIVDVYHNFAFSSSDNWARRNIHGLNSNFLLHFGFPNAKILQKDFDKWISKYEIVKVFENCPNSMSYSFFDNIEDLRLPPWTARVNEQYHITANRLKECNGKIFERKCATHMFDVNCIMQIHSKYKPYLTFNRCRNLTERIKLQHGHHCALYDAFELYLYYKNVYSCR